MNEIIFNLSTQSGSFRLSCRWPKNSITEFIQRSSIRFKSVLARVFTVEAVQRVQVVLLTGCDTETISQLILDAKDDDTKSSVRYAVGSTRAVDEHESITFSAYFDYSLACGHHFREAFKQAKIHLNLKPSTNTKNQYRNEPDTAFKLFRKKGIDHTDKTVLIPHTAAFPSPTTSSSVSFHFDISEQKLYYPLAFCVSIVTVNIHCELYWLEYDIKQKERNQMNLFPHLQMLVQHHDSIWPEHNRLSGFAVVFVRAVSPEANRWQR